MLCHRSGVVLQYIRGHISVQRKHIPIVNSVQHFVELYQPPRGFTSTVHEGGLCVAFKLFFGGECYEPGIIVIVWPSIGSKFKFI